MRSTDDRLTGLALSWLSTRPQRRGTRKALETTLWPFVEHQFARAEWRTRLEALVAELLREGVAKEQGRGGLELTAEGRARALRFLGLETAPRGLTWKKLKATYLQAHSLGLNPSRANLTWVATADGVRAALLKREHRLEGKEQPTLAQVRDQLMWRALGVETDRPFQLAAVQAHLLGKMLETDVSAPRRGVEQLAARAAGAVRVDAESVRMASVRGWLRSAAEPSPPEPPRPAESFADRVLAVARALPEERRFGPNKVFIAHVWRQLAPEYGSREAFDTALLEASRAHQLSLSRADLVSTMNPADVSESEVRASDTSFHFVVL